MGVVEPGDGLDSLQPRSRIFHMQGACFAWPRQYYYHIFHIMRPRVYVSLFHARPTPSLDDPPPRQTRDRIRILFFFNVLSFIARSAFYGGVTSVADNHDEKFIRIFDFHRRRDRFLLKVFTRKMRERGFFGGGEVRSSVG